MGTRIRLTKEIWEARAAELGLDVRSDKRGVPLSERKFQHTGQYEVSAIASLYKGRRYLEKFLDNITAQTIFDRSELIIIDANSPEGESELIAQYQKVYPNIVYKRVNHRIGIYDAWNDGVALARGRYLTNTNLDDLRRSDSFALQAAALDKFQFADVVYQDFLYSFDSDFDVEDVAKMGFKSEVPIVTANNLLRFNSPHNAPMWRARLHGEVGLFDTSFKSAGDYEFWLRCLLNGKRFYKLNAPHVVYFQNPEGISTSPQSRGIVEARQALNMYGRKLTSRYLSKSRSDFAADIGVEPEWSWETPLYNVVQDKLVGLNRQFR
ncbi:MAG: glycosyltransferase [Hyphomicrobium sp.]|uniref:glycosyltransferase n=1 Tax=Hyphomicrobium sp. TaxID=82 RepID=UPI0039E2DDF5